MYVGQVRNSGCWPQVEEWRMTSGAESFLQGAV